MNLMHKTSRYNIAINCIVICHDTDFEFMGRTTGKDTHNLQRILQDNSLCMEHQQQAGHQSFLCDFQEYHTLAFNLPDLMPRINLCSVLVHLLLLPLIFHGSNNSACR